MGACIVVTGRPSMSTRAKSVAATVAISKPARIYIATDSQTFNNAHATEISQEQPHDTAMRSRSLATDGDARQICWKRLGDRGLDTIAISKIRGLTTLADVAAGAISKD